MPDNKPVEIDPIMQFFNWGHLPEPLRQVSEPFSHLALHLHSSLPRNPERTVALRKLLEAKDAAVRARIFTFPDQVKPERDDRAARQAAPAAGSVQAPGSSSVKGA